MIIIITIYWRKSIFSHSSRKNGEIDTLRSYFMKIPDIN